jgi:hypothetical protein
MQRTLANESAQKATYKVLYSAGPNAPESPRWRPRYRTGGELAADLIATVQELQYRLGRAELTERAESTVREERDGLLQEVERLRGELEEARRPWWRRLLGS